MATLHLPSRDKVILSRSETRKKFDELSDWDKMMLSRAAMRALFMDNPDVILTIDKLKVISRDHKHPQNRKDPYGRKIWYLPIRYLRPEFECTVNPKRSRLGKKWLRNTGQRRTNLPDVLLQRRRKTERSSSAIDISMSMNTWSLWRLKSKEIALNVCRLVSLTSTPERSS